ncbi:MAG: 1,4-dihydroxy-2-naphthoate polyprenyltransferase [Paludibacter sp.]|jgi:1,4-dihydroxy-2-naphthoate polyprenyltransferase
MNIKPWIAAFRLKTLPLALSNTIIGTSLAAADNRLNWSIFGLTALTTVLLQILSNMANDYGDFVNGKDTAERIGPKRMVQSGEISAKTMLRGIIVVGILCVASGVSLIILGTEGMDISNLLIFGLLGLAAIAAAIKYTVGKNPYGYRGLGDLFVFIFFGLVGVVGTYFLQTQDFRWEILLPASAIGFLSTGVLNMNNMRDYEADKKAGKRTIVVVMGIRKAAFYHLFLVAGAALLAVIYTFINYHSIWQWFFLLSFPLFFLNLKKVFTYTDAEQLYPELPRLSMASLVFALTFGIGLLL